MPKIIFTRKGYLVMIHTRDHGYPHVTVYFGTPESYEAMLKLTVPDMGELENVGFANHEVKVIQKELNAFGDFFKEKWDAIHKKKK